MMRTTAYSRSKQKFKNKRTKRIITSQSNFSKGMKYTNTPITDGFVKTLINYEVKNSGSIITPRDGIVANLEHLLGTTDQSDVSKNTIHFSEYMTYKDISGNDVFTDVVGSLGYQTSVGAPFYYSRLYNPIIGDYDKYLWMSFEADGVREFAYISNTDNEYNHPNQFGQPMYSILNGKFYNIRTINNVGKTLTNLKIESSGPGTYDLNQEAVEPKKPAVYEALNVGFNMLSDEPFDIDGEASTVFRVLGILPKDNTGALKLSAQTGETIEFHLVYDWVDGTNYEVQWEYIPTGGNPEIIHDFTDVTYAGGSVIREFITPADESFSLRATLREFNTPATEKVIAYPLYTMNESSVYGIGEVNIDLNDAEGMVTHNNALGLYAVPGYDNTVFFSDLNDPSYFPFPQNTHTFNEKVLLIKPYLNDLIVFTTSAVYIGTGGPLASQMSFFKIHDNISLTSEDIQTVTTYQNYVLFRTGSKVKIIVPSRYYESYTGMTISDIGQNIEELLDNEADEILKIAKTLYEPSFIPDDNYESITFDSVEILDKDSVTIDDEVWFITRAKINCTIPTPDAWVGPIPSPPMPFNLTRNINVIYKFNMQERAWSITIFKSEFGVIFKKTSNKDDIAMYTQKLNIYANGNSDRVFQELKFDPDTKQDTFTQQWDEYMPFRNYQMLDTGGVAMDTEHKKRMREVQFHMYNRSDELLNFYTEHRIDGAVNESYSRYEIIHNTDPNDPDYGLLIAQVVEESNVNLLDLDGTIAANEWVLDSSRFAEQIQTKVRFKVSGKGYLPQVIHISKNEKDYEIAALSWVYRKMNAR